MELRELQTIEELKDEIARLKDDIVYMVESAKTFEAYGDRMTRAEEKARLTIDDWVLKVQEREARIKELESEIKHKDEVCEECYAYTVKKENEVDKLRKELKKKGK